MIFPPCVETVIGTLDKSTNGLLLRYPALLSSPAQVAFMPSGSDYRTAQTGGARPVSAGFNT
jgi:hypothetical protein